MPKTTAQYEFTITDGVTTVGVRTVTPTSFRRLPRSPGAERDGAKQNNWIGGRGNERFESDTTRFTDSGFCWTVQPGHIISGPLSYFCKGYRSADNFMPGGSYSNVAFQGLYGTQTYITSSFTASASYTATRRSFIVRRKGSPPPLYVELWSNSGGSPSARLAGAAAITGPTDLPSVVLEGTWSDTTALTSGTTYWLVAHSAGADADNCWEMGVYAATSGGKSSSDGSSWSAFNYGLYGRVADTPSETAEHWFFFEYKFGLYAYRSGLTGGAMYENGDRGVATGTQALGTVVDSTQSWTTNEWAGCVVHINNGTNAGQSRVIVSNTATTLTLSTSWDVAPANGTSEYVILGSNKWTAKSIGTVVKTTSSPVVMADAVYFPHGDSANLRRWRAYNNSGTWTEENANDASIGSDFLVVGLSPDGNVSMVSLKNQNLNADYKNTWQRADAPASWGTNLTFSTAKPIGDNAGYIQAVTIYDGKVTVGKTDSIWNLLSDDTAGMIPIQMYPAHDWGNTWNMKGWNTNLYFPVLDGLERLYGTVADDIGPNRDLGMPSGRKGRIMDFVPVLNHAYIALDAGKTGRSAILMTLSPGGAWHEIFRAPANKRIRNLFYQRIPSGGAYLWFGCGDDIMYLRMPNDVQSPLNDSTMRYAWETTLTTSWFDFGTPALPHYFDTLRILSQNLSESGSTIAIDYQYNDGTEEGGWNNNAEAVFSQSYYQMIGIKVAGRRIRFRLRLRGSSAATPVVVKEFEVRGVTINEELFDWIIDCRLQDQASLLRGMESTEDAWEVMQVLDRWARSARLLTLQTVFDPAHLFRGHIDPLPITPTAFDPNDPNSEKWVTSINFRGIASAYVTGDDGGTVVYGGTDWTGDGSWDGGAQGTGDAPSDADGGSDLVYLVTE